MTTTGDEDDVQSQLQQLQETLEAERAEKAELQAALEKEKEKDRNFARVRGGVGKKMTQLEEKETLISEAERLIEEKAAEMRKQQDAWIQAQFKTAVDKKLVDLVGPDEDLKKVVLFNYESRLTDQVLTADDAVKKLELAYLLATGDRPKTPDPLYSSSGTSAPHYRTDKKTDFSETEAGINFIRQLIPDYKKDK